MGSVATRMIDAPTVMRAVMAATEQAKTIGIEICAAVYDSSSQLKAFTRMDNSPLLSTQIAEDGVLIGAIGISGGHYSQDIDCAKAALKAVGAPVPG